MSAQKVLKMIKDEDIKFVDFRFTDTRGKEQHVTVPAHQVDEDVFENGKMFDGSSIAGWKGINESDMILMPEPETAVMDPFFDEPTLILRCDVLEPTNRPRLWTLPAVSCQAGGGLPQIQRNRRCGLFWSRARIFHI